MSTDLSFSFVLKPQVTFGILFFFIRVIILISDKSEFEKSTGKKPPKLQRPEVMVNFKLESYGFFIAHGTLSNFPRH